jgi:DNA-binding GntR family transcriptional regulator
MLYTTMARKIQGSPRETDRAFSVPAVQRPRDLSDEVYERLRAAILEGLLQPGVRLVETRLSEQFGISRTPLREALQKLEQEGLVSARPAGGVVVVELTKADIREISGIRQVLEGYAARLAASRLTRQELDKLAQIVQKTEKALEQGDRAEVARLNSEFHGIINRAAGSKRLLKLINSFRQHFFNTKIAEYFTYEELRASIEGHWRILEALKAGDGEAADREVRDHLAHAAVIHERMVAR